MPSGGYLDEDDWLAVCDLCRERDLFLIYDSAMERLLFDGRPLVHPLRMDGMVERTVVVGSLSKIVGAGEIELYKQALGDLFTLEVVPGGHSVLWDAFEETAAAVDAFLDG